MPSITAITTEDVEKVKSAAYMMKDRCEDGDGNITDPETVEQMDLLIEFTDVLLGQGTVDGFLRAQDMEA